MPKGIATKARHLSIGDTFGQYIGGKFHHVGTLREVRPAPRGALLLLVDGSRAGYLVHPTTLFRVV